MSNVFKFPKSNFRSWDYNQTDSGFLKYFTKPHLNQTKFTVNDQVQAPVILDLVSKYMTVTGTTSAADVDNYTITIAFKDKSTCRWEDGSTEDISLPWQIKPAVQYFAKPHLSATDFTWDGNAKSPTIVGFDSEFMTSSGTKSATGAGSFTITVALKDKEKCRWDDESTADVALPWTITDRRTVINVNHDMIDIYSDVSYQKNPDGTFTKAERPRNGEFYFWPKDIPATIHFVCKNSLLKLQMLWFMFSDEEHLTKINDQHYIFYATKEYIDTYNDLGDLAIMQAVLVPVNPAIYRATYNNFAAYFYYFRD